jgi:hypothetical protein
VLLTVAPLYAWRQAFHVKAAESCTGDYFECFDNSDGRDLNKLHIPCSGKPTGDAVSMPFALVVVAIEDMSIGGKSTERPLVSIQNLLTPRFVTFVRA